MYTQSIPLLWLTRFPHHLPVIAMIWLMTMMAAQLQGVGLHCTLASYRAIRRRNPHCCPAMVVEMSEQLLSVVVMEPEKQLGMGLQQLGVGLQQEEGLKQLWMGLYCYPQNQGRMLHSSPVQLLAVGDAIVTALVVASLHHLDETEALLSLVVLMVLEQQQDNPIPRQYS